MAITVDPDPPQRGKPCKVCVDDAPRTIEVTWTPPGTTTSYPLTAENPCVTIDVPKTAITVIIHETTGGAADYSGAVVAPTLLVDRKRKKRR